MDTPLDTTVSLGQRVPHRLRRHAFLAFFAAALIVGGGLRFVPTNAVAATSGASTACAAT